jgi:ribosome-associated translation inhibitor RaiA
MQIHIHAPEPLVPDVVRARAEFGVRKLARRLSGATEATVKFDADGGPRSVEVMLHAPGHRPLVARAAARHFGAALRDALAALQQQITHSKRTRKELGRVAATETRALPA